MAAGLCCLVSLYVTIGLRIYIRLAGLLSFRLLRHGRELYYRCYSEGMLNKVRIEYKSCFIVSVWLLEDCFSARERIIWRSSDLERHSICGHLESCLFDGAQRGRHDLEFWF